MTREKEFKTINEQISIQKNRNLKISDELQMESFIQQKNYFNSINGFETLFLLTSNPKKYIATFKTEGKADVGFYIPLAINAVLLFFYARATSGGELYLFFSTIFAFWLFFVWLVAFPVDVMYNKKTFRLESIESKQ